MSKVKLEGLFTDELERLQPTPGYMRLVKDLVLGAWQERKAVVGRDVAEAERNAKTIQQKLDRLDEAFIYAKAIDLDTYERSGTGCARSSRSRRSTDIPSNSINST